MSLGQIYEAEALTLLTVHLNVSLPKRHTTVAGPIEFTSSRSLQFANL